MEIKILLTIITVAVVGLLLVSIWLQARQSDRFKNKKKPLQAFSEFLAHHSTQEWLNSYEKETTECATALHEDIGSQVALLKINLSRIENDAGDLFVGTMAKQSIGIANDILKKVRNLHTHLKPAIVENFGLSEGMRELCTSINRKQSAHRVNFRFSGEDRRFNTSKELWVYRIIQMLLRQLIVMSDASEIQLLLFYTHSQLQIKVKTSADLAFCLSDSSYENSKAMEPWLALSGMVKIMGGRMQIAESEDSRSEIAICSKFEELNKEPKETHSYVQSLQKS